MSVLDKASRHNFVEGVTGLSSVTRCHGHNVINPQSVADHSARVSMLAFSIAMERYNNFSIASEISTFALFHDFTESLLKNDANSTIKKHYNIRELFKQVETDIVEEQFPGDACTVYRNLFLEQCPDNYYQILKLADTLDFGLYLWSEYNLGNRHLTPQFHSFETEYKRYPEELLLLNITQSIIEKIFTRC